MWDNGGQRREDSGHKYGEQQNRRSRVTLSVPLCQNFKITPVDNVLYLFK
jgi:hypothetical protein